MCLKQGLEEKMEHVFEARIGGENGCVSEAPVGGVFDRVQFQFNTHFGLWVFRWSQPKQQHIIHYWKYQLQQKLYRSVQNTSPLVNATLPYNNTKV
jgi:hypothetical protein